jgi:hypothetical protein
VKTVNDLITELQGLKPELRELPAIVVAPNGLEEEADIKMGYNKDYCVSAFKPTSIVITW